MHKPFEKHLFLSGDILVTGLFYRGHRRIVNNFPGSAHKLRRGGCFEDAGIGPELLEPTAQCIVFTIGDQNPRIRMEAIVAAFVKRVQMRDDSFKFICMMR